MVAGRTHPLAAIAGPIPKAELARHTQLVLTDRSTLSEGREFGVFSPTTWRLGDLFAKHAFIRNGLGFGGMPDPRHLRRPAIRCAGAPRYRGHPAGRPGAAHVRHLP